MPTGIHKGYLTGENHPHWAGDKIGYAGIHFWVKRKLGTPKKCAHCGTTDITKKYDWANISGKYLRRLSDWIRLCSRCHAKFDGRVGETCVSAHLTEKQIKEILNFWQTTRYTQTTLANMYHVHQSTISLIVTRKTWRSFNVNF